MRTCRTRPKRVTFVAALGRSGLDEIVHQPEGVLFVPDVPERVIAIAFLQN